MTQKHTQGPWEVTTPNPFNREIVIHSQEKDVLGANIEICRIPEYAPDVANPTNAALIAAAPDLLDVLRRIADDSGVSVDEVKSVIAKAEGR